MKKMGTLAGVALAVSLLSGCAAGGEPGAEAPSSAPKAAAEPAPSTAPKPLAAETPAEAATGDAAFLAYVRENLLPETQIPNATDEQLIEAGQNACTRLWAGEPLAGMVVVDGEKPWDNGTYYDSSAIINGAVQYYCPEVLDESA